MTLYSWNLKIGTKFAGCLSKEKVAQMSDGCVKMSVIHNIIYHYIIILVVKNHKRSILNFYYQKLVDYNKPNGLHF